MSQPPPEFPVQQHAATVYTSRTGGQATISPSRVRGGRVLSLQDQDEHYVFESFRVGYSGTNPQGQAERVEYNYPLHNQRRFRVGDRSVHVTEDVAEQLSVLRLRNFLDQHPELRRQLMENQLGLVYLNGEQVPVAEALGATVSVRPASLPEQRQGFTVMRTQ